MTQKEIDHIRRRDRWRNVIADHAKSGETMAAYCRKRGIKQPTFDYALMPSSFCLDECCECDDVGEFEFEVERCDECEDCFHW